MDGRNSPDSCGGTRRRRYEAEDRSQRTGVSIITGPCPPSPGPCGCMNCEDLEILLADYVDGTLHGEQKSALESHLASCAGCAELARDTSEGVAFIERAAEVEPPPELVTKILFAATNGPARVTVRPSWVRRLFGRRLDPILQPRVAMSMAMTVLSFAMIGKFSGIQIRQLKPSDLDPVKIWMNAEDHVQRAWERGVKYYDCIRLVFEIKTQLREWADEASSSSSQAAPAGAAHGSAPSKGSDQK